MNTPHRYQYGSLTGGNEFGRKMFGGFVTTKLLQRGGAGDQRSLCNFHGPNRQNK
jgi:hypothetical protein